MDDAMINVQCLFGHVELVQVRKYENGRLHLGGYSITRDRDGKEVSRTETTWNGSLGFDDGSPLTPNYIKSLGVAP